MRSPGADLAMDGSYDERPTLDPAMARFCLIIAMVCCAQAAIAAEPKETAAPVSFSRDVRPILAAKCFPCHGPDEQARQGELRLDDDAQWQADRDGKRIVAPGNPEASELYRRISSRDAQERMPPVDAPQQLTAAEIEVVGKWIAAGAPVEKHWAFEPPRRLALPAVNNTHWPSAAIDYFVLARLEQEGLAPSLPASPTMLVRRLHLDVVGLPPSPEEVEAFLADNSPDAAERRIDRLMCSPGYGERMAIDWLDAARFADSGGYQGDIFRTMWLWRDWVIGAFNQNMPFDQFTIEQMAGDLLPHPTREQLIATGMHRNHRINDEDGIILEEFRVEYVADRVDTTATVWLALTMACTRCHDHKYDPLSQREFYRFYAFFNSIEEQGRGHGNAPPILRLTTAEQDEQAASIDKQIAELRRELESLASDDSTRPRREELTKAIAAEEKRKSDMLASAPVTMVMKELATPRDTFILTRGAYDKPGEKVSPGVPSILPPLPDGASPNRLTLARWLVDPANPLTPRVTANRVWQRFFGAGLVSTPEDFGIQGSPPSHPQLLDWLAVELASHWDLRRLQRRILSSSTYRQTSAGSRESFFRDSDNRLLSRGPRFRLPAELVRDQALAASGLLVNKIGGPSVKPYQPEGLWKDMVSAHPDYEQGHGADLYRRSLYTFIRRTVPPPAMAAFDAPAREICAVRRPRTNTPLQALVLMNDPTYVEAARVLAERVFREAGVAPAERLTLAFRLVMARPPASEELALLMQSLDNYRARYTADRDAAQALLAVGESKSSAAAPEPELAAYAAVCMAIFNLDEAVTKE